jgi:uncharacterized protein (TIGR02265 family)
MLKEVTTRAQAIHEVGRFCDIEERLTLLPPSTKSRGVYFQSIETVLSKEGRLEKYKQLFPERFAAVLWYPTSELLSRLVVAGGLLAGPEHVHQGMFEIGRLNAVAFAESLLGKVMMRLLSRDPKKLLQQGVAGRRQGCSVGHWELSFPAERKAVISMHEEYLYLESYMLGAGQGTFDAIGVPVKTRVEQENPFTGKHVLEW